MLQNRQRIEALVENLVALLDCMDGDPDLEPDHDGEAEPEERSAQRLTLAPDHAVVRQVARPPTRILSRAEVAQMIASADRGHLLTLAFNSCRLAVERGGQPGFEVANRNALTSGLVALTLLLERGPELVIA